MINCIATCVTIAGLAVGNSHAEEIRTGYLIIGKTPIDPPYRIDVIGSTLAVNGIQVHPWVVGEKQIQKMRARAQAKAERDALHEGYYQDKQLLGEEIALENLKGKLNKKYGPGKFSVKSTRMGMALDVPDGDKGQIRIFLTDDQTPSQRKKIIEAEDAMARMYAEWREEFGKTRALDLIEKELAKETMITEFSLDRERETYKVLWKGSPVAGLVALRPEGDNSKSSTPHDGVAARRIQNKYAGLTKLLRGGDCVLVLRGNIYNSLDGKPACDSFMNLATHKTSRDVGISTLSRYFLGSQRYIWEDMEQVQDSE